MEFDCSVWLSLNKGIIKAFLIYLSSGKYLQYLIND